VYQLTSLHQGDLEIASGADIFDRLEIEQWPEVRFFHQRFFEREEELVVPSAATELDLQGNTRRVILLLQINLLFTAVTAASSETEHAGMTILYKCIFSSFVHGPRSVPRVDGSVEVVVGVLVKLVSIVECTTTERAASIRRAAE
jgi:hypothetical protein